MARRHGSKPGRRPRRKLTPHELRRRQAERVAARVTTAWHKENRRRGRAEDSQILQNLGWSRRLADAAVYGNPDDDRTKAARAVLAAYDEQQDIYAHGLQPKDLKDRKGGRKRHKDRKPDPARATRPDLDHSIRQAAGV